MIKKYPLEFTLEDGVHVTVNKTAMGMFDFTLRSKVGGTRQFTYVEDNRTKEEIEQSLDFDEINALRKFWLEKEKIV